jgi:hypothetical protein
VSTDGVSLLVTVDAGPKLCTVVLLSEAAVLPALLAGVGTDRCCCGCEVVDVVKGVLCLRSVHSHTHR